METMSRGRELAFSFLNSQWRDKQLFTVIMMFISLYEGPIWCLHSAESGWSLNWVLSLFVWLILFYSFIQISAVNAASTLSRFICCFLIRWTVLHIQCADLQVFYSTIHFYYQNSLNTHFWLAQPVLIYICRSTSAATLLKVKLKKCLF